MRRREDAGGNDLLLWDDDLGTGGIVGAGDGVTKEAHGTHHLAGSAHPVWEVRGVPYHLPPCKPTPCNDYTLGQALLLIHLS